MGEKIKCPVCQSEVFRDKAHIRQDWLHLRCRVCGACEWKTEDDLTKFDKNQLAAYLAYHAIAYKRDELRYHTTWDKESCDTFNQYCRDGELSFGRPVHIDADIVASWYPKSFAEKVDHILLYIFDHAPHLGQTVQWQTELLYSILFIDRYEFSFGRYIPRSEDKLNAEVLFMLRCLEEQGYIQKLDERHLSGIHTTTLMPSAYARIDEIQKNTSNGRNVLVAMKFGEETKLLREAIRQGVQEAGFSAVFIDEVQHNDFITPELLKHIRDSKFVVVDLTHKNNGAYFEEGYAMGLGKPVIQLCKKRVKLHFDIAQKNTIMWASEDDIPGQLRNRIIATIE